MFVPLLGFGAGWYAREKGVSAEDAALITLGTGVTWLSRSYIATPLMRLGLWAAADVGAGVVAGTTAAVGASSVLAVGAAVAVPTAVGYVASYALAGDQGTKEYKDFLKTTVTDPIGAVYMLDSSLNRAYSRFDDGHGLAPIGNAAGIAAGTTEWEIKNPTSRFNPFTGEPNRAYQG